MEPTVQEALARFAEEQVGAGEDRFRLRVGALRIPFPNPGRLAAHDLHHVVLGAPASFWGEVHVSAFELRSGPPTALIWLLCLGALGLGVLVRPRQVIGWLRRYRGCANLYGEPRAAMEALRSLPVDTLRARLGVPAV